MSPTIGVGLAMRVRYDLQAEVARLAESLGYDGLWFPEHLVWPADLGGTSPHADGHPPADPRIPTLDALMWMVTIAQATSTIRLGTYVYNLALRHPFVAARAVQTLDVISGGRVDFGVGAGWSKGEYDAAGVDFSTRGRRLDETIAVLRELWTAETPGFTGTFFDFAPLCFEPKPPQGRVPILIGGESAAAMRRAGTIGDGWIGMTDTPESARERVEVIRGHGREVTVITGGQVRTVDDLQAYADAGVDRLIVSPWRRSTEAQAGIEQLAAEVLAPARERGLLAG